MRSRLCASQRGACTRDRAAPRMEPSRCLLAVSGTLQEGFELRKNLDYPGAPAVFIGDAVVRGVKAHLDIKDPGCREYAAPPSRARVNPACVVTGDRADANLYAVYLVDERAVLRALIGEPRGPLDRARQRARRPRVVAHVGQREGAAARRRAPARPVVGRAARRGVHPHRPLDVRGAEPRAAAEGAGKRHAELVPVGPRRLRRRRRSARAGGRRRRRRPSRGRGEPRRSRARRGPNGTLLHHRRRRAAHAPSAGGRRAATRGGVGRADGRRARARAPASPSPASRTSPRSPAAAPALRVRRPSCKSACRRRRRRSRGRVASLRW